MQSEGLGRSSMMSSRTKTGTSGGGSGNLNSTKRNRSAAAAAVAAAQAAAAAQSAAEVLMTPRERVAERKRVAAVGPGRCCLPCHPTHLAPSCVELVTSHDVASDVCQAFRCGAAGSRAPRGRADPKCGARAVRARIPLTSAWRSNSGTVAGSAS
jgi:hypothetical protein